MSLKKFFSKADKGASKFFGKVGSGTKQFVKGASQLGQTVGSAVASGAGEVGKVASQLEKVAGVVAPEAIPLLETVRLGAQATKGGAKALKDVSSGGKNLKDVGTDLKSTIALGKQAQAQSKKVGKKQIQAV